MNFTVLGSYAHLAHLRHESKGLFHYFCILICPLVGAIVIIVQTLALGIQLMFYRDDRQAFERSVAILVGRLPRDGADRPSAQEPSCIQWPPKPLGKKIRRLVVPITFFARCATSVFLLVRGWEHGSVALYDHRILQLAVLGLDVAVMYVVHIVLEPQHPFSLSDPYDDDLSEKFEWLWWLRPTSDFKTTTTLVRARTPGEEMIVHLQNHFLIFDMVHLAIAKCAAHAVSSEIWPYMPCFSQISSDIMQNFPFCLTSILYRPFAAAFQNSSI